MLAAGKTDYEQKPPFFVVLQYSVLHTSRNYQRLLSIFLNRFFLTYLASMCSAMVHIDNSLFIPADEDAQHSSQVSRKARGFHHPKVWGRALISATHQSKAATHLLLNQQLNISSHWQLEGSGCLHFTGNELSASFLSHLLCCCLTPTLLNSNSAG